MRFATIRRCGLFACERGAAAAEMALVLPFLIVLLFGSVELGHYFYVEHQVVKGVRDGARYASRQPFSSISCPSETVDGALETKIKEVTRTGRITGGTARVPGWTNDDISVDVTCAAVTTGIYRDEPGAPQVSVVANVAYNSLFGGLGVVDSTFRLNASQQAAVMGL
jgi:Flp pilus assembly protein TadG